MTTIPQRIQQALPRQIIFTANGVVPIVGNDYKHLKELVPGDMVLGAGGKFSAVRHCYRPRFARYDSIRYKIVALDEHGRGMHAYVEVSGESKVYHRNIVPNRDFKPSAKAANTLDLHKDGMELCRVHEDDRVKSDCYMLGKIGQSLAMAAAPWVVATESGTIVVNHFIIRTCDAKELGSFMKMEDVHAKELQGAAPRNRKKDW